MKKFLAFLLLFCLPLGASAEIDVVASLFPQYDFARIIAGDRANVTQLLPPGQDSHGYEPSMRELIGMSDRIYVMRGGAIVAEIQDKADMTQENILAYTIGKNA